MRNAGFGPAYKSLTVQPAPLLKNPPLLSQVRMEYWINLEKMKVIFQKNAYIWLMNNSNQNLLLPSQAREAKRINTQKLIFNLITYSHEKYRLFVEGVRFELTSPHRLLWYSANWAILQCSTGYLHRLPVPFIFAHTKFLESKLKSY